MGSQQTGSDVHRRVNAPTVHQNSLSPPCPMMAPPPPLWPSCQMNPVWSTLPLTPAWRTTASQAARPAWLLAAAARRVSVSGRTDVCVCVWSCSVLHDVTLKLSERERELAGVCVCQNDRSSHSYIVSQSKPDACDRYSNIHLRWPTCNVKLRRSFNLEYSLCSP